MYNVWSIVWSCIHSKIMPELVVNRSSKIMLAHALLSLLVFNHGFIQIRFNIFENFCFCFMISKYALILWNFARCVYSVNAIYFFIDEKRTQQNLNTKLKVFHESILCFMKWPSKCIPWNVLEEKFHSASLPLNVF